MLIHGLILLLHLNADHAMLPTARHVMEQPQTIVLLVLMLMLEFKVHLGHVNVKIIFMMQIHPLMLVVLIALLIV